MSAERRLRIVGVFIIVFLTVLIYVQRQTIASDRLECAQKKEVLVRKYDSIILRNTEYLQDVEKDARKILMRAYDREFKINTEEK